MILVFFFSFRCLLQVQKHSYTGARSQGRAHTHADVALFSLFWLLYVIAFRCAGACRRRVTVAVTVFYYCHSFTHSENEFDFMVMFVRFPPLFFSPLQFLRLLALRRRRGSDFRRERERVVQPRENEDYTVLIASA